MHLCQPVCNVASAAHQVCRHTATPLYSRIRLAGIGRPCCSAFLTATVGCSRHTSTKPARPPAAAGGLGPSGCHACKRRCSLLAPGQLSGGCTNGCVLQWRQVCHPWLWTVLKPSVAICLGPMAGSGALPPAAPSWRQSDALARLLRAQRVQHARLTGAGPGSRASGQPRPPWASAGGSYPGLISCCDLGQQPPWQPSDQSSTRCHGETVQAAARQLTPRALRAQHAACPAGPVGGLAHRRGRRVTLQSMRLMHAPACPRLCARALVRAGQGQKQESAPGEQACSNTDSRCEQWASGNQCHENPQCARPRSPPMQGPLAGGQARPADQRCRAGTCWSTAQQRARQASAQLLPSVTRTHPLQQLSRPCVQVPIHCTLPHPLGAWTGHATEFHTRLFATM